MLNIKDYDYFLSPDLIAKAPACPRDSSKLMVYDTKSNTIYLDRFYNLDKYLPSKSFLVLNNTKVIPARISLYKVSGGKVKILFLVNEISNFQASKIRGYADRKVTVGEKLFFDDKHYINTLKQESSIFTFELNFSLLKLFSLLMAKGTMPIPLYIKDSPLTEIDLRKKYQTIFAKIQGSSAAPTASLHFTDRLFKKLDLQNIRKFFVTLHVGLGTFAPIDEENIRKKQLHEELYRISPDTFQSIRILKCQGYNLVAVGTTVVRTLESRAGISDPAAPHFGQTNLFIFPPYNFQMVDCLITNFHLPKSSLMLMVEAFLRYKKANKSLIDLYKIAIAKNFRFYSFGDGMLIR